MQQYLHSLQESFSWDMFLCSMIIPPHHSLIALHPQHFNLSCIRTLFFLLLSWFPSLHLLVGHSQNGWLSTGTQVRCFWWCNWAAPTSSSSHYCSSSLPDTNFWCWRKIGACHMMMLWGSKRFFMLFLFFMCVLHACMCDNVI